LFALDFLFLDGYLLLRSHLFDTYFFNHHLLPSLGLCERSCLSGHGLLRFFPVRTDLIGRVNRTCLAGLDYNSRDDSIRPDA
jgi:hypothetical protein